MSDSPIAKILSWLNAGYPEGIPQRDFPSVLLVLHRNLSDGEIESIADDLALQSISNGAEPVTADHIRAMVRDHAFQSATARGRTAGVGGDWPAAAGRSPRTT